MIERALQLQSAAADVLEIFAKQADRHAIGNLSASLFGFLIVHQHRAGENHRLRAFTRRRQTTVHQQFVESDFHEDCKSGLRKRDSAIENSARGCTTKVPALASVQSAEASLG